MTENKIIDVLMKRDNLTFDEAQAEFDDVISNYDFQNFSDIEDACDEFGLELDYAEDIIYAMQAELV